MNYFKTFQGFMYSGTLLNFHSDELCGQFDGTLQPQTPLLLRQIENSHGQVYLVSSWAKWLGSNRVRIVLDGERLNQMRSAPTSGVSPSIVAITHGSLFRRGTIAINCGRPRVRVRFLVAKPFPNQTNGDSLWALRILRHRRRDGMLTFQP